MTTKRNSEERTLRRCLPCWICGVQPEWGAAFLVCPNGHHESDYDEPKGAAARDWNRLQKDKAGRRIEWRKDRERAEAAEAKLQIAEDGLKATADHRARVEGATTTPPTAPTPMRPAMSD